ncbi:MAG TPA: hypothetical protein DCL63_02640, partial [Firmicutes bacterium]|nr:hypothetical protein [Bacillota bacterium]
MVENAAKPNREGDGMLDLLKEAISGTAEYAEIRYHKREQTSIEAKNGRLARVERRTLAGAGVRCL